LPTFLDELFTPFCIKLTAPSPPLAFGQIFRVPAYYPHTRLQVWRPKIFDRKLNTACDFNLEVPKDAFVRQFPYSYPPLATNEEFLGTKAKRRPVILIQPPDPKLTTVPAVKGGGKLVRNLAPVGLLYSVVNAAQMSKYAAAFLDRVRLLEYPQFLFIPSSGPILVDSLARFDELQSVDVANLEPTGYSINPEVIAILKSQLSFFLTGLTGQAFQEWATLLRE
jgi:hypothetical protein